MHGKLALVASLWQADTSWLDRPPSVPLKLPAPTSSFAVEEDVDWSGLFPSEQDEDVSGPIVDVAGETRAPVVMTREGEGVGGARNSAVSVARIAAARR